MAPNDLKISVNGRQLHVIDWGGPGEPIICLHGLTANGRSWDRIAERLSPEYRVIAYDLPGRGDSAKPDRGYGIPSHAGDIPDLMDRLGIDSAVIAGHSLGAAIGCYFAAHYGGRIKKLILIDGGMDPDPALIHVLKPSMDRLGKIFSDFGSYLDYMKSLPFFSEWTSYFERNYYHDVSHFPDGTVCSKVKKEAIAQDIESFGSISLNRLHSKIKAPTLVLWAPLGLLVPGVTVLTREKGEEIARTIPGSRFAAIDNSNHYSIIMKDQTVNEIRNFLGHK